MFTDIADCYPSIYTHSITWAMYGKEKVKNDENKCSGSLGDKIDKKYLECNTIKQMVSLRVPFLWIL